MWTCAIATFRNGLKTISAYQDDTDTEAHMVEEVGDLFTPREGYLSDAALDRLVNNRPDRHLNLELGVNFENMTRL